MDERWVTLTTVVRVKNWPGRLYMLVAWPIHGPVVRRTLHRARYALSPEQAPAASAEAA